VLLTVHQDVHSISSLLTSLCTTASLWHSYRGVNAVLLHTSAYQRQLDESLFLTVHQIVLTSDHCWCMHYTADVWQLYISIIVLSTICCELWQASSGTRSSLIAGWVIVLDCTSYRAHQIIADRCTIQLTLDDHARMCAKYSVTAHSTSWLITSNIRTQAVSELLFCFYLEVGKP
jgi:hypothetical protein